MRHWKKRIRHSMHGKMSVNEIIKMSTWNVWGHASFPKVIIIDFKVKFGWLCS